MPVGVSTARPAAAPLSAAAGRRRAAAPPPRCKGRCRGRGKGRRPAWPSTRRHAARCRALQCTRHRVYHVRFEW